MAEADAHLKEWWQCDVVAAWDEGLRHAERDLKELGDRLQRGARDVARDVGRDLQQTSNCVSNWVKSWLSLLSPLANDGENATLPCSIGKMENTGGWPFVEIA